MSLCPCFEPILKVGFVASLPNTLNGRDAQIGSRAGLRTAAIKFQRCSALSLVEAAHCQFGRRGDPIVGLEPTSSIFRLEGAGRSTASILSQATKTKKRFDAEHLVSPCILCPRLFALCGERTAQGTNCLLDPFVTILQVHLGMGHGQGIAFRKIVWVELIAPLAQSMTRETLSNGRRVPTLPPPRLLLGWRDAQPHRRMSGANVGSKGAIGVRGA
jgi:hypothetical protein